MINEFDICIIGGGIIGASIARELAKYDISILVLEANPRVAQETSAGNSGLVHAGFDPTPGRLNAQLNIKGKLRYEDWIREMQFPYLRIDSTIVAFTQEEMDHIKMLYDRGLQNGLHKKELKIIDAQELQIREPNISKEAIGALIANSSIAVDTVELTKTLFTNAIRNGVKLKVNSKVVAINRKDNKYIITNSKEEIFTSTYIINATGHYADEISSMAGYPDFKLKARRGEYRILEKSEAGIVNSVVFMVPTIHGKGVIVSPMLDGRVMVGPTAVEGVAKNETRLVTQEQYDLIGEIGKKLIPSINMNKTVTTFSGSRPIETQTDDFWIRFASGDDHFINVAGMKSPAIASAPAIADYVIELVEQTFGTLKIKPNYQPQEVSLIPLV
ncbi:type 2 glycerol-3-phosphate oxidase [Spiroplasma alleghenense]|uniref:Glycerol-3-phosphate oxidase n=1 Tax=Spiroplasma alleghenense TaxID=216931 RepID=A0A345Z2N9_9MOLU|nr:type 2 glycerol-3-phosphate oxidase [Spiroplasma alleghenense]AXK50868.1 glycerol-3-phosphate oxidase [Spiroplasma alleghenense]